MPLSNSSIPTAKCLYCACFVRPILEFSSVVWSPYFKTDINKIESVQKRFTKDCLPKLNYNERLSMLGLQTLESRRIMSDLTTCHKILNNNIDTDLQSFFSFSHNTHTRGNSKKLAVCRSVNIRHANLFHHRVVN